MMLGEACQSFQGNIIHTGELPDFVRRYEKILLLNRNELCGRRKPEMSQSSSRGDVHSIGSHSVDSLEVRLKHESHNTHSKGS